MKALYGSGQLTGIPWLLYPPEKSRYLFYKRLAGPQGQSICNGLFLQRQTPGYCSVTPLQNGAILHKIYNQHIWFSRISTQLLFTERRFILLPCLASLSLTLSRLSLAFSKTFFFFFALGITVVQFSSALFIVESSYIYHKLLPVSMFRLLLQFYTWQLSLPQVKENASLVALLCPFSFHTPNRGAFSLPYLPIVATHISFSSPVLFNSTIKSPQMKHAIQQIM